MERVVTELPRPRYGRYYGNSVLRPRLPDDDAGCCGLAFDTVNTSAGTEGTRGGGLRREGESNSIRILGGG